MKTFLNYSFLFTGLEHLIDCSLYDGTTDFTTANTVRPIGSDGVHDYNGVLLESEFNETSRFYEHHFFQK